ncbi:MAG: cytochrome c peroxidase [Kofleriaceae bacterium]
MKKATPLLVVLAVGLPGCKKESTTSGTSSSESPPTAAPVTPPTAPPPTPRPSQVQQPVLPALELPEDAKRAEKVALGHALFFDPRLSVDGSRACYSCHQNEDGNGGHDPLAIGPGDKPLPRHSPVIWNVGYYKNALYWDGRAATLEDNAKAAWGGGNMGVGKENLEKKAAELGKIKGYKKLFDAAFPGEKKVTPDMVASAIAEYERTLVCNDTAYDKYAGGDKTALSEEQQRGLDVFLGKGMCAVCHAPPHFSTAMAVDGGAYFNVGIGTAGKAEAEVDVGRMKVSNAEADWAAFKPPSLRNIGKSAPYFHDGSVAKLEDAVALMASGGVANKAKSPLLSDRGLTDAELADLVAFLRGLDCGGKLEAPTLPK